MVGECLALLDGSDRLVVRGNLARTDEDSDLVLGLPHFDRLAEQLVRH
jgi:hypothetical protein